MAEKKSFGRKVMGWFVVDDNADKKKPDISEESVDDLIKRYADDKPAAPPPPPVELKGDLPRATGGQLDLPRIFAAAGISAEEQGRVVRAQELLKTLPAETPVPVKRQIVEASLKAFGYPIDDLIEAGAQEIQALEAYIQREAAETQRTLGDASKRIEQLTQEIADLRKLMQTAIDEQNLATQASNAAKLPVQQVLEFFGEDAIARVVHASPKLQEPPKE